MQYINANAHANTQLKVVANLYYPGYAADNALANCTDSGTGQRPNKQNVFLPSHRADELARLQLRQHRTASPAPTASRSTWRADYDSNGDGQIDSDAIRYVQGESEAAYVDKITTTLPLDAPRREHATS